jgi:hypothetical protein
MYKRLIIGALALTTIGLAACGEAGPAAHHASNVGPPATVKPKPKPKPETALEKAATICDVPDHVSDAGHTLELDTEGEEDYGTGDSFGDVTCTLAALDAPDAFTKRLEHTRALDGTQHGEWGDYTATWTYHPDHGLWLVIETA